MKRQIFYRRRNGDVLRPLGLANNYGLAININYRLMATLFLIIITPIILLGAYQPAALLSFNNLSDLQNAGTARGNLGLGTAATKAASGSGGTVASVTGSFTAGHLLVAADTAGTEEDGGAPNPGWTITTYTSSTNSVTLADTSNLIEEIAQGTPAALTINLNATNLSAGFIQCVKDKSNTFATNNATVKTTDSSTIDSVAGTTGFVMNQTHENNCFVYDGAANWMVL